MDKLTKVRLNIILTIGYDYIRSYQRKDARKHLKEKYKRSYNLYFKDLVKELWTTGTYDINNYMDENSRVRKMMK